jgi:hypothetical protein
LIWTKIAEASIYYEPTPQQAAENAVIISNIFGLNRWPPEYHQTTCVVVYMECLTPVRASERFPTRLKSLQKQPWRRPTIMIIIFNPVSRPQRRKV